MSDKLTVRSEWCSISGTDDEPGLLPQFAADLYERIGAMTESTHLEVAYFELYKEKVASEALAESS